MHSALAFVPHLEVADYFNEIKKSYCCEINNNNLKGFLDYFQKYYISIDKNSGFVIDECTVIDRLTDEEFLTTNSCEGLNRVIKFDFPKGHPSPTYFTGFP